MIFLMVVKYSIFPTSPIANFYICQKLKIFLLFLNILPLKNSQTRCQSCETLLSTHLGWVIPYSKLIIIDVGKFLDNN